MNATSLPPAPHLSLVPTPPASETRLRAAPLDGAEIAAHRRYVLNFALRRVGNVDDAEDIVQEAMLRAFLYLPDEPKFFRSYLCRIVINLIINRWRRRRDFVDVDDTKFKIASDETPAVQFETAEARARLFEGIENLRPKVRQVVKLILEGMTYADVATALGMPLGTVCYLMYEARQALSPGDEAIEMPSELLHVRPIVPRTKPRTDVEVDAMMHTWKGRANP
jgi:RNA polymerase sigma-70 factor (ECF subfamily)